MPRYYFHLWANGHDLLDGDGTVLPNDDAAELHAKQVARELIKSKEVQRRTWRLDVADRNGARLFRLRFSAVDDSLEHLDPGTREVVQRSAELRSAMEQTILNSRLLIVQTDARTQRALGRPYLTARDGRRVL